MRISGAQSFAAIAAVSLAGAIAAAAPARAQDCAGNPDALGTSRVLAIDPADYPRVGSMQYPVTLPLDDHEVVITFDDGPLPPSSTKILDILAAQCVKANYFLIGEMAHAFPDTVRRIHQEGHVIGTHSQTHPINIRRLPDERVQGEIEGGIASVGAALGDPAEVAPFFRIPGLERSDILDDELEAHSLVTFSADVVADDWHRHITPAQIIARAMSRLEAKGKGILLLHDIHPWTAAALPGLLKELKDHGFHVVQVVPAAPGAPQTMIAARQELTVSWTQARQDAMDDSANAPRWPKIHVVAALGRAELTTPDAAEFDTEADVRLFEPVKAIVAWPAEPQPRLASSNPELATPSVQDIGWPVQERRIFEHHATETGLELRQSVKAAGLPDRRRVRHAHLKAHLNGHRHARAPAAGQHAGLLSSFAALITPAH
jgi:peptidoglycan/xylan/chitin deacetylase (PgdA/CDA1 family)